MGFLRKVRSGRSWKDGRDHELILDAGVADDPGDVVELPVVGESYRQDALERIAGPKEADGKSHLVGVTLRCEPTNEHDSNAVRVEVLGQLVGYIARDIAAQISAGLAKQRGVLEAGGMIVGGWDDGQTEGHYGCRVWIPASAAQRLGMAS
jgi:hypothetical protein